MPKRIIKVNLSSEDRKTLEKILISNKSTQQEKIKAEVLLLTDIGEYGPKCFPKDVAAKLNISTRSVGRIREVYAQTSSISNVFKFTRLSKQTRNQKLNTDPNIPNRSQRKKNIKYIELDDGESFLMENIKCRVTLNKNERELLESVINNGKQSMRKFNRAKILLLADEGPEGPSLIDREIAEKLDVSTETVARVRRLFVSEGKVENILNFNHNKAGRPPKIDGTVEATLIAQACSTPPQGRCKWTLQLLADRLVELEVVEAISHTAVAKALKKMNLSLGNGKNG